MKPRRPLWNDPLLRGVLAVGGFLLLILALFTLVIVALVLTLPTA
jgi:hypothetical protein